MKIIYKIAKAELQSLFFSPIAWLILILYTFQTGMDFAGLVDGVMKGREMGYDWCYDQMKESEKKAYAP